MMLHYIALQAVFSFHHTCTWEWRKNQIYRIFQYKVVQYNNITSHADRNTLLSATQWQDLMWGHCIDLDYSSGFKTVVTGYKE